MPIMRRPSACLLEPGVNVVRVADFLELLHRPLVRAAVRCTLQRADGRRHRQ